jgi:hypothetical protein
VFRESAGKSVYPSALLLREIERLIQNIPSAQGERRKTLLINALLRAGEIECALADLRQESASCGSALTDAVARTILSGDCAPLAIALSALQGCALPERLTVTAPEGFAYYALDPFSYVEKVRELKIGQAAVIGIRSIGTVLSALAAAEFGCERITVRPTGHPYDRELKLTPEQLEWICKNQDSTTVIVDEGPGLSGSSFLAVAEAIVGRGVPRERLIMIGSNVPDPAKLVAHEAAGRWARFRYEQVERSVILPDARPFERWDWRRELLSADHLWPPSWQQMSPPKLTANDGRGILKFEGLGRAGDVVRERARVLADAGFAPRVLGEIAGFTNYEFINGEPSSAQDLDDADIQRIADYIAFRAKNFRTDAQDTSALDEMTRHNVAQLVGVELAGFQLPIEHPIICDARLMPHEWIRTRDGRLFKADGVMHGDDHFFPGPCDVAWDVASAIVEWDLAETADRFLTLCEQRIDKGIRGRLDSYLLAYSAFQAAYAKMAGNALAGTEEAQRFSRSFDRYVALLKRAVEQFAVKRASFSA